MKLKMNLVKLKDMKISINLFYDFSKWPFDFRTFKTIRSLGDDIYNKRVNADEADQEQSDLFDYFFWL